MRGFAGIIAAAAMAGAPLASCSQAPKDASATDAWVRLPAVEGNPGAAYFKLNAGSEPIMLLDVDAKFAVRTELHESMKGHAGGGSMMSMQPLKQVAVPAGDSVIFAPAGKHVMLFDVSPSVKAGDKVPLTLALANGKNIEVQASVVGAGDPAPGDGE